MKRIVKAPAKELTAEEKIELLQEERHVLQNETDDTPASLERIEHINRDIQVLEHEISVRPEPVKA